MYNLPSPPFKIDLLLIALQLMLGAILFTLLHHFPPKEQISGVIIIVIFLPLILLKSILALVALILGIKNLVAHLRRQKVFLGLIYSMLSFGNALLLMLILPEYTLFPSILLFSVLLLGCLYFSIWRLASMQKRHYQIVGLSHLAVFSYLYIMPLLLWLIA